MKVSRKLLDQGLLKLAYILLPNPNIDYYDFVLAQCPLKQKVLLCTLKS